MRSPDRADISHAIYNKIWALTGRGGYLRTLDQFLLPVKELFGLTCSDVISGQREFGVRSSEFGVGDLLNAIMGV